MTKKVIADPPSKDQGVANKSRPTSSRSSRSSSRQGLRMTTRSFDKQMSEEKVRINRVTAKEESIPRPSSGSSERSSYKDIAMAPKPSGNNNQFHKLNRESQDEKVTRVHHQEPPCQESHQAPREQHLIAVDKTPDVNVHEDHEIHHENGNTTQVEPMDTDENWTTVQYSKKKKSVPTVQNSKATSTSPRIVDHKATSTNSPPCEIDTLQPPLRETQAQPAKQGSNDDLRRDMHDMKEDIRHLMTLFQQNIRPASVISVRNSQSNTARSIDVESVTSKVVYKKNDDDMSVADDECGSIDNTSNHVDEIQDPPKYEQIISNPRYVSIQRSKSPNDNHPKRDQVVHRQTNCTSDTQPVASVHHVPVEYFAKNDIDKIKKEPMLLHQTHRPFNTTNARRNPTRFDDDDCSEKRHIHRTKQLAHRANVPSWQPKVSEGIDHSEHRPDTRKYTSFHNVKIPKEENESTGNDEYRYSSRNDTDRPLFGQNEFSLKCSNNKIKYSEMVSFLKDKSLDNDEIFQIEKLYNNISGGIMFAMQSQVSFMPSFRTLSKEISFSSVFLDDLIGTAFERSKAVFDRFGEIVKDHLTAESTISMDKCPKAYRVIQTAKVLDGWSILEKLLRRRVVLCGAKADVDLDVVLSHLTLKNGESIHSFFLRTQQLSNQYKLQYRNEVHIPTLRILTRFVQELMRAPEYVPYLANQYRTIMQLSKEQDQREQYMANDLIPYTVEMIYDILDELNVTDVPSTLTKSTLELHNEALTAMQSVRTDSNTGSDPLRAIVAVYESTPELVPVISQYESAPNSTDCVTPSICAFRQPRKRCHACLIGLHDEINCFLRGQAFMPEELRQRINRYNATHGSTPPPNHKPPPYKPSSVSAEFDKKNKNSSLPNSKHQKKKSRPTPFSNNKTKQPSVNWLESEEMCEEINSNDDEAYVDKDDDKAATISAFVAGQIRDVEENGDFYLDSNEEDEPVICVVESSLTQSEKQMKDTDTYMYRRNADYDTPMDLLDVISSFHRRNKNIPNQHFLRQHAHKLSRLPHDIYRKHSVSEFQVDSGANVGAVNDRSLFYFFIPSTISVEQAGGECFTSAGWGGVLIELNGRVRLHAPVHYTPTAPRNIFSPGAMISYSGFKESNHKLHQSLDMVDNIGKDSSTPVVRRNGLNFAQFQIMAFDHHYYDMTRSVPKLAPASVYRTPNIVSNLSTIALEKQSDTTTVEKGKSIKDEDNENEMITLMNGRKKVKTKLSMPCLPHSALSHIASMYINLFPAASPRSLAIAKMNNILGNVYKVLPSTLPQIFINQPIISSSQLSNDIHKPIISSKLTRKSSRTLSKFQEYVHLHTSTMHSSDSTLIPMLQDKLLRDLPPIHKDINNFDCTCIFCTLTKATKLPRGHLVDYTRLQPFQQLHMDYSIYNHTSLRGMTSALGVVCASTSYPFGFPTKNRNPPLDTVKYLVRTLRSMGFVVNFIRVDEDGALAKSAEFCRLIIQLDCILQTTSGGNSESNGKVERPHRTQANMVRAALSTMKTIVGKRILDECKLCIKDFWCFAYTHAIHVQRRIYSRAIKDIPYYVIHKKRPSARELVPFGSIVTVVNPSKDKIPKLSEDRASSCFFLGFGNHVRSILYWCPKRPRSYKRSYHAIIEDTMTFALIQNNFSTPGQMRQPDESIDVDLVQTLEFVDQPFDYKDIKSISFDLPPKDVKIGLCIRDDEIYNIPYLWKVEKNSIGNKLIPKPYQRNHFILHINGNSPITSNFVREHIQHLQNIGEKELHLDLVHRGTGDSSTTLEISRAIFDQLPCLHQNRPVISSIHAEVPSTHLHFIRSASKPAKPKFFHECLKSPLRRNWIAAAKVAFEKNQRIAVFSLPFPKSQLSPEDRVFGTTLVPEVKQTDVPGVWELRIRECTIGTKQEKSIDFEESYSPTINDTTIKIQIAFCAALGYTISIIDVKNAFQNTISKKEKRIFVSVPPTYLEWLDEFDDDFTYSKDIVYVRQMLNANQGTRDAGNQWYILLMTVLMEYGLIRSTIDHGFFVRDFGDLGKLYVSLATDDLLCGYLRISVFHDFVTYLRKYFTIVVQHGNVLKFLGARIIQSDHAISMDHAQYIFNICQAYFGKDATQIRTVSIPMRTDGEFEKELYESPPLSESELVEFALKFKGGYRNHIGKLNFPISTRFDIQFAVQRLSEFSCAPTEAAFNGIDRIYRYLANDILRPLVFPRESLHGSSSINITLAPDNTDILTFKHAPTLFTDAELARDLNTRRSYYCVVVTLMGVIILCKIRKSSTVMLHTTDSEAQASYDGVRRLIPIRAICEFMGYPLTSPSTHFVDNAAVHQIITSQRMTPRCRHFDLPIAFLHEQFNKVYDSTLIKTWKQLGDIGTKPLVRATHKKFKYIGSGERYLPPKNTQHYNDLEMEYYEMKLSDIHAIINSDRP